MISEWGGAGFIFGAVLGLRFNFLALVPAICLGLVVATISGIARGDGVWPIAGTTAVFIVALELGYLVVIFLPLRRRVKNG
jgi:hypothetical protein